MPSKPLYPEVEKSHFTALFFLSVLLPFALCNFTELAMATIRLRPSGNYQAMIRRKGHPLVSQTFDTFQEAESWAKKTESAILELRKVPVAPDWASMHRATEIEAPTLAEALDLYQKRITPTKKGAAQELRLIRNLQRHPLAALQLDSVRSMHLSRYRDMRLAEGLSGNTVRIELALISHLFSVAVTDWGFETLKNPVKIMRKPKIPRGRDRRFRVGEEERLLDCCDRYGKTWLKLSIILAVETAMRRGELFGLRWQDVDLKSRMVYLGDTKNGDSRAVPLSTRALAALETIKANPSIFPWLETIKQPRARVFRSPEVHVLAVYKDTITNQFLDMCRLCDIEGLRFHDLRHEATSRLFEKGFNSMEVSTITGHKSLTMLKRYTHLNPVSLLSRMDAAVSKSEEMK